MIERQTPTGGPKNADKPPAPKTDPVELLTLFSRFVAANFLAVVTIVCIFRHQYPLAVVFAVASAVAQRATVKLYRRLRDERNTALEAMRTGDDEQVTHAA